MKLNLVILAILLFGRVTAQQRHMSVDTQINIQHETFTMTRIVTDTTQQIIIKPANTAGEEIIKFLSGEDAKNKISNFIKDSLRNSIDSASGFLFLKGRYIVLTKLYWVIPYKTFGIKTQTIQKGFDYWCFIPFFTLFLMYCLFFPFKRKPDGEEGIQIIFCIFIGMCINKLLFNLNSFLDLNEVMLSVVTIVMAVVSAHIVERLLFRPKKRT